jgi:squalene-hopene/tetraprenyl-beta-curcumene cyclase
MMIKMKRLVNEKIKILEEYLLDIRNSQGVWDGHLSSSAISTSVACFALFSIDRHKYAPAIDSAIKWLHGSMFSDGSWGDSSESRPNITATLLSYAALYACDKPSEQTLRFLTEKFGGTSDRHIIDGVLKYYGTDLTFSAPILVMCAVAGVIRSWDDVPQLPFEMALLPQSLFRFLQLPVVSYAIPALIAVGILRHRNGRRRLIYRLREKAIPGCLRVLSRLQPVHGGFLEAPPLTAFVAMCMAHAGYVSHPATQLCASFLSSTVREDGSWAIDTNLAQWNTSLAVNALGDDIPGKETVSAIIKSRQFKEKHPFTGAIPGGWGWTGLPGAIPDADDTPAALIALHALDNGVCSQEVRDGIVWLLKLQNRDGGIPTFCKGWGKLPFDRSSPDLSAHTLKAFRLWEKTLPEGLQKQVSAASRRIIRWLSKTQKTDGSWTPLWFGDQDVLDETSPVYGTSVVVEHLAGYDNPVANKLVHTGSIFIAQNQNADGGWGGVKGIASKVTITGRAVTALVSAGEMPGIAKKGVEYICRHFDNGVQTAPSEPIGLYFARLWYSEQMYGIYFPLLGLKKWIANSDFHTEV